MELTISQIKQKQKDLKKEITDLLNKFNTETGVVVKGEVCYGYTEEKHQQYIYLNYSNPFEH